MIIIELSLLNVLLYCWNKHDYIKHNLQVVAVIWKTAQVSFNVDSRTSTAAAEAVAARLSCCCRHRATARRAHKMGALSYGIRTIGGFSQQSRPPLVNLGHCLSRQPKPNEEEKHTPFDGMRNVIVPTQR